MCIVHLTMYPSNAAVWCSRQANIGEKSREKLARASYAHFLLLGSVHKARQTHTDSSVVNMLVTTFSVRNSSVAIICMLSTNS